MRNPSPLSRTDDLACIPSYVADEPSVHADVRVGGFAPYSPLGVFPPC